MTLRKRIEAALRVGIRDCECYHECTNPAPDFDSLTAAVLAVVEEERDTEHIALMRAQGALADAGLVPTGNVEQGIRLLTARVGQLEGALNVDALTQLIMERAKAMPNAKFGEGCRRIAEAIAALARRPEEPK